MANTRPENPSLGLVIPCYNEEAALPHLLDSLETIQKNANIPIRVLLVDDGSQDRTYEIIGAAIHPGSNLACISFSRNFGHQIAVSAGLHYVVGDVIGVIDADLQDPPEVLLKMVNKWREGFDVVYGVRRNRKENLLLRSAYSLFYRTLQGIANIEIPLDAGDFCVMDRRVVELIKQMPEQTPLIRGLRSWVGFRQTGLEYERAARVDGESKYSLSRLVNLAVHGIVSFSALPLRLAAWLGFFTSIVGFALMFWAIVGVLAFGKTPPGWASLAVIVLFFSGVQLIVLGIIGEYLGRIFEEVKHRPRFIVESSMGWVAVPRQPGA
jgi:polyisoprenyl-phosphate glycosyltransferase